MELPTGRELYEKYKGQKAAFDNMEGIVCGYSSESAQMICAITVSYTHLTLPTKA